MYSEATLPCKSSKECCSCVKNKCIATVFRVGNLLENFPSDVATMKMGQIFFERARQKCFSYTKKLMEQESKSIK